MNRRYKVTIELQGEVVEFADAVDLPCNFARLLRSLLDKHASRYVPDEAPCGEVLSKASPDNPSASFMVTDEGIA